MKNEFAALAYLAPKKLPVILAKTFGWQVPPIIAVMVNLKTKQIELLEVTL